MEDNLESVFHDELISGERIHWVGQPDSSIIFNASDLFMIPFSLMWGGFALFWEGSVLGLVPLGGHPVHGTPFFFKLWGVPFVLLGLYMIFGRFFFKVWKKKRIFYAVTDKRVIVLTQTRGKQVQAQFINQIPVMNKSVKSNEIGTLSFGGPGFTGLNYGNTGMDFLGARSGQGLLAFYDIPEAERVFQLIQRLRDEALNEKGSKN